MNTVESITYEELLRECHIENPADFRNLLRNRKGLPQVSPRKLILRKEAEAIVKVITGQHIDWYKYESKERDQKDEGPLDWSDSSEILNSVNGWFLEIDDDSVTPAGIQLVALACEGGFLVGHDRPACVINFNKGINVIIGDRGSGKSTVLSLLSAVSDSVGEETQVLVRQLLSILHPDKGSNENEKVNLNRRILKMLRHYGINEYGVFFAENGSLNCYYINKKQKVYSYLKYIDNAWQFQSAENSYLQIPLLSLSQGEVIRIAEDREQGFYLNNLLDAIYPDLFQMRTKLFQSAQDLLRRSKNYQPLFFRVNTGRILHFLQVRLAELDKMQRELERGEFSQSSENLIYSFLDRSEDFLFRHPEKVWDTTRIIDFFTDKDEDVLYYLYVTRIKNFLFTKLSEIKSLRRTPSSAGEILPDLVEEQGEDIDDDIGTNSMEENVETPESQILFEEDDEDTPPALDDDLEEIDVRDESKKVTTEEEENNLAIFLKSIGTEQRIWESRELLNVASEVVVFLRNRLMVLSNWRKIYTYKREKHEDELRSLTKDYINLLEQKSLLIQEQSKKCAMMTSALNKDNFAINITTAQVEQTIIETRIMSQKITALERRYYQIQHATPSIKFPELRLMQSDYDNTLIAVKNGIKLLDEQINQNKIDYFTFPIRIELLQGNTFREFQQLSFGQKSGIILKMVLSTTTKSIIVIDQPEDNLDAFSIINIIAPALKNLQTQYGRQIIVVTHNSNLVMETSPDRLIALESRGDNGRIKFLGPPVGKQAVREIFDILEGGVSTFSQKIKTYENFVGMAKKVEDWDIHLIESSFRQRTIDGLRNYLQPIVTDSSMLDFLRHQLKQWDPKEFRQHIREFINRLEKMEETPEKSHDGLFIMLTGLAEELDYHIQQFMISINEIRMMDTEPKRKVVDLYAMLKGREDDGHIHQIRRSRRINIKIDPDLQGVSIIADPNHFELVFKNLMENSLRATEKVVNRNRRTRNEYIETISITLEDQDEKYIRLIYSDNGCGVSQEILKSLYKEPCSTKDGKEGHGLGGIIIRKLLEINDGSITVMESNSSSPNSGLTQKILLRKASFMEVSI